jgi:importin subunit beta-1
MQVVCEATQNQSVAVQVGSFECLVRIMGLYYDKMALYMEQALFGVRSLFFNFYSQIISLPVDCCWDEAHR